MLGAALHVGVTPVEAKEIVYQAIPYVGLAKVFDFLHATNDVLTRGAWVSPVAAEAPEHDGIGVNGREAILGADCLTLDLIILYLCLPGPNPYHHSARASQSIRRSAQ